MHRQRSGRMIAGLVLSIGCSAESSRPAPATPRPASAAVVTADTTTQATADTAPLAPGNAVYVATPDTSRCAVLDTARKNGAIAFIDSVELVDLRTANGKASRVCGALRISLLNGRTRVFTDDTTAGLKFGLMRYAGYLKTIHSHVVHRYPYEGTGAFLVVDDSTGDARILFGMPVASPDGKRFVLTSMVDEARYDPGMIEIWRMAGRRPEKEFSYDTEESPWQPSDPEWRDSSTIDFIQNTHDDPGVPYVETPGRLIRSRTVWTLAAAPIVTANPVGVWRGTSLCTQLPSPCKDEIVVYRIARVNAGDSLSVDARKIVDGLEEAMGVIGCRIVSGTQFRCPMPQGTWYFKIRGDSLFGDLRFPGNSPYRDVRATRLTN